MDMTELQKRVANIMKDYKKPNVTDKVAYYKGKEIARENAVKPFVEDAEYPEGKRYNREELNEFHFRIQLENKITYDNSKNIEYFVRFE